MIKSSAPRCIIYGLNHIFKTLLLAVLAVMTHKVYLLPSPRNHRGYIKTHFTRRLVKYPFEDERWRLLHLGHGSYFFLPPALYGARCTPGCSGAFLSCCWPGPWRWPRSSTSTGSTCRGLRVEGGSPTARSCW